MQCQPKFPQRMGNLCAYFLQHTARIGKRKVEREGIWENKQIFFKSSSKKRASMSSFTFKNLTIQDTPELLYSPSAFTCKGGSKMSLSPLRLQITSVLHFCSPGHLPSTQNYFALTPATPLKTNPHIHKRLTPTPLCKCRTSESLQAY